MRKNENALVAAIQSGDADRATDLLRVLVILDRRRAWWALFRAASAVKEEDRRAAMLALVARTYIARRMGRLVGVPDEPVVGALAGWLILTDWDRTGADLTRVERAQLARWLPARISRLLSAPPLHPKQEMEGDHG
jgi:hypothetical protein